MRGKPRQYEGGGSNWSRLPAANFDALPHAAPVRDAGLHFRVSTASSVSKPAAHIHHLGGVSRSIRWRSSLPHQFKRVSACAATLNGTAARQKPLSSGFLRFPRRHGVWAALWASNLQQSFWYCSPPWSSRAGKVIHQPCPVRGGVGTFLYTGSSITGPSNVVCCSTAASVNSSRSEEKLTSPSKTACKAAAT